MKTLAKIFLSTALFLFLLCHLNAQSGTSGKIYFTNGATQSFIRLNAIFASPYKDEKTLSPNKEGLYVSYQNSYRTVPFTNLRTIVILPERINGIVVVGELEITTKNGITFTTPITIGQMNFNIKDDLTNSIIDQSYHSAKQNVVQVARIEFD